MRRRRPATAPARSELEPGGAAGEHRGVAGQDRHDGDRFPTVQGLGRRHVIGRCRHDQRPVIGAGELGDQPPHHRARHHQAGVDRRIDHHRDHLDGAAAQVETDAAAVTADPEHRPPRRLRSGGAELQQVVSDLDRVADRDGSGDDRRADVGCRYETDGCTVDEHRTPTGELHQPDAAGIDDDQGVVGLDGRIVEPHCAPAGTPHQPSAGLEREGRPRVGAGGDMDDDGSGHTPMWVPMGAGRKSHRPESL